MLSAQQTGCPFRYSGYDAYRRQKVGHSGKVVPELDGIQELLKRKQIGYASVRGGVSNRAENPEISEMQNAVYLLGRSQRQDWALL